jgi:hypothetical protein
MNELDLIRSFRADVPPPSPVATGRARRAWRPPLRRRRRPRPRAVALAGALAAVGTAMALVLPADDGGRLGSPPSASAAQVLKRAAAAQTTPARPLRRGEFWYVRTRARWLSSTEVDGSAFAYVAPTVREDWIAIDGYRGFRTRAAGPPRFLGPRDRARWIEAGRPELFVANDGGRTHHRPPAGSELARKPFYDGSQSVSYRDLLALPRDPVALHDRLRRSAVECECGQSVEQETFVIVGDLMRDAPIPGDLRAALLRAAAHIPGIERTERIRDVAGRLGTGVAIDSEGTRSVLIFDRESYELLGESQFALDRVQYVDAEAGELVSGSAIMAAGIVDSPTAVVR